MKFHNINDELSSLLQVESPKLCAEKDILIYGAGNFGKEACHILTNSGFNVVTFLDKRATIGEQWQGIPIFSPEWSGISNQEKKHVTVLIAIHNREVNLIPIIEMLRGLGYRNIINPVDFYQCIKSKLADRFWLTSPQAYQQWGEEISQGLSIWEDEASRLLYLSLLRLRLHGNYSALPIPDLERQYFPLDIPAWQLPLRFVDCGAYDGDTLRDMKSHQIPIEQCVALEPDEKNFALLSQYASREWGSLMFLYPCGAFSRTQAITFSGNVGESGKISMEGDQMIQGIALDDILHNFQPNLIKMDIEGGEIEGLIGARRIIEQDRPGLAICVYHKPQHLWQIPNMIDQWGLGYKFYLRSHGYNDFDVVMYGQAK